MRGEGHYTLGGGQTQYKGGRGRTLYKGGRTLYKGETDTIQGEGRDNMQGEDV